jgi:hypothetical protein
MFIPMDEEKREQAIKALKKGVLRILDASEALERREMIRRVESDDYVGSVVRRVIAEG